MRAAIMLAGGREVCFACELEDDRVLVTARVVARGDATSVLAMPGFAVRGEMLVHNHPSGDLTPSDADHEVADKYGTWQKKTNYGRSYMGIARTTYLIGADGKVAKRWDNVKVDGHAEAVLDAVKEL